MTSPRHTSGAPGGTPPVYLRAVGTALPGPPIDNAALAARFGFDALWEQWIDAFIGTRSRHLATDLETGEQYATLAELAATAADRALAAADLAAADVDAIVLGTATPDQLMPATVNLVADRIGANGLPAFQLQSGCCGAVQALDVARLLLLTGTHRTVLVLGGDVCAKYFDVTADLSKVPPAELVNVVLFGDAAGAAVLSTEPAPGALELRRVVNRLTGLGQAPGQVLEWFGPAQPRPDRIGVSEDYKAIEQRVPDMAADVLAELLADLAWKPDDVDFLLPPQLSGRMTARIVAHLGLPAAHEVSCVDDTGNTGNALPFHQLARILGQVEGGQRVLGIAVESSKWITSGYAFEGV